MGQNGKQTSWRRLKLTSEVWQQGQISLQNYCEDELNRNRFDFVIAVITNDHKCKAAQCHKFVA